MVGGCVVGHWGTCDKLDVADVVTNTWKHDGVDVIVVVVVVENLAWVYFGDTGRALVTL